MKRFFSLLAFIPLGPAIHLDFDLQIMDGLKKIEIKKEYIVENITQNWSSGEVNGVEIQTFIELWANPSRVDFFAINILVCRARDHQLLATFNWLGKEGHHLPLIPLSRHAEESRGSLLIRHLF